MVISTTLCRTPHDVEVSGDDHTFRPSLAKASVPGAAEIVTPAGVFYEPGHGVAEFLGGFEDLAPAALLDEFWRRSDPADEHWRRIPESLD